MTVRKLTSQEIHARTQEYLAAQNIKSMQALVAEVATDHNHEDKLDELVHAILEKDFLEMAKACFDGATIQDWCNDNSEYLTKHCPNVFISAARPTGAWVDSVGKALNDIDDAQKLAILEGRFSTKQGEFLYCTLRDTPTFWTNLTPFWIGGEDSLVRQAAHTLGWTHSMLPKMLDEYTMHDSIDTWIENVDYPYSLMVASSALQNIEREKEAAAKAMRAKSMGGFSLRGKPVNMMQMQIECKENANPWDVALALVLREQTDYKHVLVPHKKMPAISQKDYSHLESVVAMHLALDCLPLVMESLCRDELLGLDAPENDDSTKLGLPDLGVEP